MRERARKACELFDYSVHYTVSWFPPEPKLKKVVPAKSVVLFQPQTVQTYCTVVEWFGWTIWSTDTRTSGQAGLNNHTYNIPRVEYKLRSAKGASHP